MDKHDCLLCMGSNRDGEMHLGNARKVLSVVFPDIHFGSLMTTNAVGSGYYSPFCNQLAMFTTTFSIREICRLFKEMEQSEGRKLEDKKAGWVNLDIDLLTYDARILKETDMQREYIRKGLEELDSER